jgi:hypothetical protein
MKASDESRTIASHALVVSRTEKHLPCSQDMEAPDPTGSPKFEMVDDVILFREVILNSFSRKCGYYVNGNNNMRTFSSGSNSGYLL